MVQCLVVVTSAGKIYYLAFLEKPVKSVLQSLAWVRSPYPSGCNLAYTSNNVTVRLSATNTIVMYGLYMQKSWVSPIYLV